MVIKTMWYWHKDNQIDHWIGNKIRIVPYILIFDQGTKETKRGRKHFHQTVLEQAIYAGKKKKNTWNSSLTLNTKIDLRWIILLNMKARTMKLLEKKKHRRLFLKLTGRKIFLFQDTQSTNCTRNKLKKWTFINIQNFCSSKDTVKNWISKLQTGKNIHNIYIWQRTCIQNKK